MEYALPFRIYPNAAQRTLIAKTFGCCRYVYNHYLGLRKIRYERDGSIMSRNDCSADLTSLKKVLPWLSEVDSIALQSELQDLDRAYENFFRGLKSGNRVGYPKFKFKKDPVRSYRTKQHIVLSGNRIRLPKLGWVKCRVSKEVRGRILNATVSQDAVGDYFVSVCWTDADIPKLLVSTDAVGIDLGTKDFAVLSDGRKIGNPRHFGKLQRKLRREQKLLSRKRKGSSNYRKQKAKVAKIHRKIANCRSDFLHKLSMGIVREYGRIAIENLAVGNMLKNHKLAKSIADASWSEFRRQLAYKSTWYGRNLKAIDRFYPSSQVCHVCGSRNPAVKDLSVREWDCSCCNAHHDRDINAAINIRDAAFRTYAG